MNNILTIVTLIAAVISIIGTFYGIGKFVATLTAAINNAVEIFTLKISTIEKSIEGLKDSNEKLADILNDISTRQIVDIKVNIAKIDESLVSAHYRIEEHNCRISKLEDK